MEVIRQNSEIIIMPSVHLCTIVCLHGLGDSAEWFLEYFLKKPLLPNCKVVLPTAPHQPVTVNGGHLCNSWFDFKSINDEYDPSAEDSVKIIIKILEEERPQTQCLILGGFSQGAVMSLYTGLSKYEGKLEAIIALSGYAFPMTIPEERKTIPILAYNGSDDPLLTLDRCVSSMRRNIQGTNLTLETENGLVHTISNKELEFIRLWLETKFPYTKTSSG